jgi:hypothetical protein
VFLFSRCAFRGSFSRARVSWFAVRAVPFVPGPGRRKPEHWSPNNCRLLWLAGRDPLRTAIRCPRCPRPHITYCMFRLNLFLGRCGCLSRHLTPDFLDHLNDGDDRYFWTVPGSRPVVKLTPCGCGVAFDRFRQSAHIIDLPVPRSGIRARRNRVQDRLVSHGRYTAQILAGNLRDTNPGVLERVADCLTTLAGVEPVSCPPPHRSTTITGTVSDSNLSPDLNEGVVTGRVREASL